MSDPSSTFLQLAGSLDHPVFIVTAAAGERREGCVNGFATQSSFDPFAAAYDADGGPPYFQQVKHIDPGHLA